MTKVYILSVVKPEDFDYNDEIYTACNPTFLGVFKSKDSPALKEAIIKYVEKLDRSFNIFFDFGYGLDDTFNKNILYDLLSREEYESIQDIEYGDRHNLSLEKLVEVMTKATNRPFIKIEEVELR